MVTGHNPRRRGVVAVVRVTGHTHRRLGRKPTVLREDPGWAEGVRIPLVSSVVVRPNTLANDYFEPPPSHAHVLLEALPPVTGVGSELPVVCAGDLREVYIAIICTLYQRVVWGVQQPVLGFVHEEGSAEVRAIIGWYEGPLSCDAFVSE